MQTRSQEHGAVRHHSTDLRESAVDWTNDDNLVRRLETENTLLRKTLLTVGHELRTPLASIVAYNDLLARNSNGSLSELELKHLSIVRRNAMVLDILISDLANMTNLGTDSLPITPGRFEVGELLRDVFETVQPFFETKEQELTLSLPNDETWLEGDRDRLQQVAINLLTNASKFSASGTQIDLSASSDESNLTVRVADHGIGMSLEEQAQIFDSFFRVDPDDRPAQKGLGLGLYISSNIVDAHGGHMMVSSRKGEGTTVGFTVPLESALDHDGMPADLLTLET